MPQQPRPRKKEKDEMQDKNLTEAGTPAVEEGATVISGEIETVDTEGIVVVNGETVGGTSSSDATIATTTDVGKELSEKDNTDEIKEATDSNEMQSTETTDETEKIQTTNNRGSGRRGRKKKSTK